MMFIPFIFNLPVRYSQVSAKPDNNFYVENRSPLLKNSFLQLPIGSIQAKGWLHTQLVDEANGFTGHLDQLSEFLSPKDNAWQSPVGKGVHGWEEVPYWLRGYGDLAYELKDKTMIAIAKKWIEPIIESQRSDGYFGPRANLTAGENGSPDVWPNMLALQCLESYYDFSGDKRVIGLMTNYFHWEVNQPDEKFLKSYWENERAADNMSSVIWLYNRSGNKSVLPLIAKLHRCGANWVSGLVNLHGVNFGQSFREPAEIGLLTHSASDFAATRIDLATMRARFGQVPGGMYGADENARNGFSDPRQATETCAMVETMMSDEDLLTWTGDPAWGDHCEDVTFNDLPASMTPNEKSLHYLTSPNMVVADKVPKNPGIQNGGPMFHFDPYDHRCCQHNAGMGWPKFTEHLWMAAPGNGIAMALYAPSQVRAKVGKGASATFSELTQYPFRDTIQVNVGLSHSAEFPFFFRVPAWAKRTIFRVNGKICSTSVFSTSPGGGGSQWKEVLRKWKPGDKVTIKFPMEIEVHHWSSQKGAVSISRGPLSYALKIKEAISVDGGTKLWPAYSYRADSMWNYGLDPSKSFKVVEEPIDANLVQPFAQENAPVEIITEGRVIPQWQVDPTGLVNELQKSPARVNTPLMKLTLVPMSTERLRISEFPTVTTSKYGTKWSLPERPHASLPASASHCWESDSVSAMTNGLLPRSSDDQSIPRFTWYDHLGTLEWAELDFPVARTVSKSELYWFDDRTSGGACRVPANWKLQAWIGGAWQTIPVPEKDLGVKLDTFNSVKFQPIKTTRLRVSVQLRKGRSGGILQWKI